jgi:hypothetical protein
MFSICLNFAFRLLRYKNFKLIDGYQPIFTADSGNLPARPVPTEFKRLELS